VSRKRQRLESFREVVRDRPRGPRASKPLTLRDRLAIWSALLAGLAVILGAPLWGLRVKHRATIESRVNNWGKELNLLPKEINGLKKAEFLFHGSGNPFVHVTSKSGEEMRAHKLRLLSEVRTEVAPLLESRLNSRGH